MSVEQRNLAFSQWMSEMIRVLDDKGVLYIYPARRNDLEDFLKYRDIFDIKYLRMPRGELNRDNEEFYRVVLEKK